ncbi:hypothetical protein Tco_0011423 [Tanacetum coccineum]
METEEVSDRFVSPCFINGLEAYDGEINLGKEENMISNEFAVKLCLDHEVKCRHKVVKKELIVALRGEIYFVKFIINPEKDDVKPGVVLGRSFMRLTKGIADFRNEVITIYPKLYPFLDSSGEIEKIDDDWDLLLDDLDFGDIPKIKGVEIPPFTMGTHDDEAESSRSKHFRQYETVEEAMLPRVHHPFLHWEGYWNVLNHMGCGEVIDEMLIMKLSVAGIDEEIFTLEVCTRAFNIDEPIYNKICHEFYSTYEFDEVCADDELRTKKIIKFRIYGHAFSWTLIEFVRKLELYHSDEINEEGFDVYFQGGLHSDEHFNAQEYWLSISQEENLSLSRSHASTIHKPVLRVLHKMITYGLCQRTTGYDKMQKNDLWLLSMFEARHQNGYANVAWLIADEEERSCLSALIYCRALDTTTLRELIDSEGRLIPKVLEPGVPRVAIPRPPRASTQDLYERMGSMEIPQGAIERMSYRQCYH